MLLAHIGVSDFESILCYQACFIVGPFEPMKGFFFYETCCICLSGWRWSCTLLFEPLCSSFSGMPCGFAILRLSDPEQDFVFMGLFIPDILEAAACPFQPD